MQFWYIEEGEKKGPLADYEIRDLIKKKTITRDTRVWHEGADDWLEAHQVGLLAREFAPAEPPPIPVILKQPVFHPWRRLGARWFDVILYQLILVVIFRLAGWQFIPLTPEDVTLFRWLISFLPLIVIEAALLHSFQTTPGKWLLGLKVKNATGEALSLGSSLMRGFRVWVLGMGMHFPIFILIAHALGFWFGKKRGAPLWDLIPGYRVESKPITGVRIVGYFVLIFFIMTSVGLVAGPEAREYSEQFSKDFLEQLENR